MEPAHPKGKDTALDPQEKTTSTRAEVWLCCGWISIQGYRVWANTVTFPEGNDTQSWNRREEKAEQHRHSRISPLPHTHENLGNCSEAALAWSSEAAFPTWLEIPAS